MSIRTFAALGAAFNAKYPEPGNVGALSASASVGSIEAAGVRPYGATAGKLVYVKALDHFYVTGPTLITAGEYIQVLESDANDLVRRGQAQLASDAEIAKANADAAAANKVVK